MRRGLVVLGIVCSTTAGSSAARADGLPDGTWFVLRVDAGVARCESWTAASGVVSAAGWQITTSSDGSRVYLDSADRDDDHWHAKCDDAWSVHDAEHGDLDVDGARWFHTRAACTAAIAHHARLAMEVPACTLNAPVASSPATRKQFERVLSRGGSLYEAADCSVVAVRPDPHGPDSTHGHFVRITDNADQRETRSTPYSLGFGDEAIDLEPSTSTVVRKHPVPADSIGTGAYGCVCVDADTLSFGEDWVEFDKRYYLARASCKQALAATRTRDSWRPKP